MIRKTKEYLKEIRMSLLTSGSFVQNSAWMFASSGISILIQFGFFFLLAKIYSPAVYGIFGIFNVYVSTLGNAATLGYNQAFVLPKEDKEFSSLLHLTLRIALFLSAGIFLITIVAGPQILQWFSHEEIGDWVYWIGPTMFLLALDRITADWAIRNKEFKKQTLWSTTTTLAVKSFNVWYGWAIAATSAGLVYTTLLQHILRAFTYGWFVLVDFKKQMTARVTWPEMVKVAKAYKEFPLFIYWGNLINIFSNNLPAALITTMGFAVENVGFYAYSLIVLDLPIRMLGSGIASVFMQKAAELARERMHELAAHTWRLYKSIVLVSLIFSFVIYVFGEKLYLLLLDEKWVTAGRVAEVLIVFYFFRMISSPLSSLFNILRKEKQFFIFQVMLTILRIAALLIGGHYTTDFIQLMFIYSMTNAFAYLIFTVWIFRLIGHSTMRVTAFTLGWSVATFVLAYLAKTAIFG